MRIDETAYTQKKTDMERAKERLKQLKKYEAKTKMYSFKSKNGVVISAQSPERLEEIKKDLGLK